MARAAIILAILAVVLNAQCFGACIASKQTEACHHTQQKSVERCDHNQLITDKQLPSPANPLTVAILPALIAPPIAIVQTIPTPVTKSPSPPPILTILKI